MFDFKIITADKIIQFKCSHPTLTFDPSEEIEFKHFLYSGERTPDIIFGIEYGFIPAIDNKNILFRMDDAWTLSDWNGKMLIEYYDRSLPNRMERVAVIDAEMDRGIIYVNRERTKEEHELARIFNESRMTEEEKRTRDEWRAKRKNENRGMDKRPRGEPRPLRKDETESLGKSVMSGVKANFFQAFFVEYLVKKRIGFLVHSACVQASGETHLYMGMSGAGKSTISRLMHDNAGARVLNDDRGVLSVEGGKLIYYNAPWLGDFFEHCDVRPEEKAIIDRIFFIYHDGHNHAEELSRAMAASKLFANSFPVFWSGDDLDYALGICAGAATSTPCYGLGFVNDKSAVEFIENFMKPGVSMRLLAESSETFRL